MRCKFKHGFSIDLCKKKHIFDFKKKGYSETLIKVTLPLDTLFSFQNF